VVSTESRKRRGKNTNRGKKAHLKGEGVRAAWKTVCFTHKKPPSIRVFLRGGKKKKEKEKKKQHEKGKYKATSERGFAIVLGSRLLSFRKEMETDREEGRKGESTATLKKTTGRKRKEAAKMPMLHSVSELPPPFTKYVGKRKEEKKEKRDIRGEFWKKEGIDPKSSFNPS